MGEQVKTERLGDRLRRLRLDRDLSIEEVARGLGISSSTYREWENGRAIRGEPYVKMRDFFQVSLEELMTGKKGDQEKILGEIDTIERHINVIRFEVLKCV
ncbi:MAG: helix-turn-helix transcriptional regulator [Bdellovibrionales bacterium]|nr:helix-turn-helix transcriptional regulator [Bdellovibrionales bacterium]